MVGAAGRTDTKLLEGGIEEVIGISAMIANHKDVLNKVLSPAIVYCIDNLFVHEFGPKIRHYVCHGLTRDGTFYSDEYVYAGKFIFSLVLLPLINEKHWPAIKEEIALKVLLPDPGPMPE